MTSLGVEVVESIGVVDGSCNVVDVSEPIIVVKSDEGWLVVKVESDAMASVADR